MNTLSSSTSIKVYIPDNEFVWLCANLLPRNSNNEVAPSNDMEVEITDDCVVSVGNVSIQKVINVPKILQSVGLSAFPLQNADNSDTGVEDMCSLGYLHEASILHNLKRRFISKLPYTYTGNICIAINPYQWLDIYTTALRELYSIKYRSELPPHVYATSFAAYRGLRDRRRNQSILVSGESGAGKTETVKILMNHIADISSRKGDKTIDKVLEANPLLESFGNAKTVRNDNSSRFGKFIELQFDEQSMLSGSKCVTYLLEKTRVVSQTSMERNYHILYQLLASPDEAKKVMQLAGKSKSYFNYVNSGDQKTDIIEGIHDSDRYHLTIQALSLLGISGNLRNCLLQSLAGVLYLGQITFSGSDSAALTSNSADISSTCLLLGIQYDAFAGALTMRSIEVEGKQLKVPLTVEQAVASRDAFAKELYSRIFLWLVHVINFNTSFQSSTSSRVIGLLDIFGFESFVVNRFEQLMINYANEKLQQKFTQDVFETVQIEYQEEGLAWDQIAYKDNAEVLELVDGRRGLLAALNEECLVPKGSDSAFLSKIKSSCNSFAPFSIDLVVKDEFSIKHYAGVVSYNVNGFLDRNKDTLSEDLRVLLLPSSNPLLASLFHGSTSALYANATLNDDLNRSNKASLAQSLLIGMDDVLPTVLPTKANISSSSSFEDISTISTSETSGKSMRKRSSFMLSETVSTKFKNQLASLMETISSTEVQYVRCIKPNSNKSSSEFNRKMVGYALYLHAWFKSIVKVVEQLRSAGVIEAIAISRAAYPNRLSHE